MKSELLKVVIAGVCGFGVSMVLMIVLAAAFPRWSMLYLCGWIGGVVFQLVYREILGGRLTDGRNEE